MVPVDDLPTNIFIRVIFPEIYDFSYVYSSQCSAIANN